MLREFQPSIRSADRSIDPRNGAESHPVFRETGLHLQGPVSRRVGFGRRRRMLCIMRADSDCEPIQNLPDASPDAACGQRNGTVCERQRQAGRMMFGSGHADVSPMSACGLTAVVNPGFVVTLQRSEIPLKKEETAKTASKQNPQEKRTTEITEDTEINSSKQVFRFKSNGFRFSLISCDRVFSFPCLPGFPWFLS